MRQLNLRETDMTRNAIDWNVANHEIKNLRDAAGYMHAAATALREAGEYNQNTIRDLDRKAWQALRKALRLSNGSPALTAAWRTTLTTEIEKNEARSGR